jgi:hypothetical protein
VDLGNPQVLKFMEASLISSLIALCYVILNKHVSRSMIA